MRLGHRHEWKGKRNPFSCKCGARRWFGTHDGSLLFEWNPTIAYSGTRLRGGIVYKGPSRVDMTSPPETVFGWSGKSIGPVLRYGTYYQSNAGDWRCYAVVDAGEHVLEGFLFFSDMRYTFNDHAVLWRVSEFRARRFRERAAKETLRALRKDSGMRQEVPRIRARA